MKKPFLEKVTIAEEHLGHKLPQDYLDFIKDYGSQCVGFGYWFDLEELELATEYDIVNFLKPLSEIICEVNGNTKASL